MLTRGFKASQAIQPRGCLLIRKPRNGIHSTNRLTLYLTKTRGKVCFLFLQLEDDHNPSRIEDIHIGQRFLRATWNTKVLELPSSPPPLTSLRLLLSNPGKVIHRLPPEGPGWMLWYV